MTSLSDLERAFLYLEKIPGAVARSGGHQKTFGTLAALRKNFDVTESQLMDLARKFNERCEPNWTEKELQHKVSDVWAKVAFEPKPREERAAQPKPAKLWPTVDAARAVFAALTRAKDHESTAQFLLADYGFAPAMIPADWRVMDYHGKPGIVYPGLNGAGKVCALKWKSLGRDAVGKRQSYFLFGAGGVITNLLGGEIAEIVITGGEEKAAAVIGSGMAVLSPLTGEGSLTPEWVRLVALKCNQVILGHDNDAKGRQANDKTGLMLLKAGLAGEKIKVVIWPENFPDSGDLSDILKLAGFDGLKDFLGAAVAWIPPVKTEPVIEVTAAGEIFDSKGKIIPLHVARRIHESRKNLVHVEEAFWHFTGRVYEELDPRLIDRDAIALIGGLARTTNLNDIRRLLSVEALVGPGFFVDCPDKLALQNGVFNLQTGAIEDHSPVNHVRNLLPIEYDEKASCVTFQRVFAEWLPDEQARSFLLEFMGYLLTPDTSQERSIFLVGEGANGKSVFVKVLEALLGHKNCSAIPLQALKSERTFPTAALKGKLLNVSPETETPSTGLGGLDEGWLKSLVSGDAVEVELKGRDSFWMVPTARFVIHGNNPPHVADKSEGFWRKMEVVRFPNSFVGTGRDTRLFEKLRAELPGIFNLALDGLYRLRERGQFEISPSMEEERTAYRRECNPLRNWIEERVVKVAGDLTGYEAKLSIIEAYLDYTIWCKNNGHNPYSRSKFTREMKREGLEISSYRGDFQEIVKGLKGYGIVV